MKSELHLSDLFFERLLSLVCNRSYGQKWEKPQWNDHERLLERCRWIASWRDIGLNNENTFPEILTIGCDDVVGIRKFLWRHGLDFKIKPPATGKYSCAAVAMRLSLTWKKQGVPTTFIGPAEFTPGSTPNSFFVRPRKTFRGLGFHSDIIRFHDPAAICIPEILTDQTDDIIRDFAMTISPPAFQCEALLRSGKFKVIMPVIRFDQTDDIDWIVGLSQKQYDNTVRTVNNVRSRVVIQTSPVGLKIGIACALVIGDMPTARVPYVVDNKWVSQEQFLNVNLYNHRYSFGGGSSGNILSAGIYSGNYVQASAELARAVA